MTPAPSCLVVQGWDAAVKCVCLARMMMCSSVGKLARQGSTTEDYRGIDEEALRDGGIKGVVACDSLRGNVTTEEITRLATEGKRIKMLCVGEWKAAPPSPDGKDGKRVLDLSVKKSLGTQQQY